MAVSLDEVDIRLLTALQSDADRTNVELARVAGLSPAATLHRVRYLKESGVIRIITARLDPAAVGFPLQLYVAATLGRHDPRSTKIFEDQVRALPQIILPVGAGREHRAELLRQLTHRELLRQKLLGLHHQRIESLDRQAHGLGGRAGADDPRRSRRRAGRRARIGRGGAL